MSGIREFISERLTAAAEEIFSVFQRTIAQYEEELDRQRRLLDGGWRPDCGFQRADFPLCSVRTKQIPAELQLQNQQDSSLDHPQIKEEQEDVWSAPGDGQLVLKQEPDVLMVAPSLQEGNLSEPESDRIQQERPDRDGGWTDESGPDRDTELKGSRDRTLMDNCPLLESKRDRKTSENLESTTHYRIHTGETDPESSFRDESLLDGSNCCYAQDKRKNCCQLDDLLYLVAFQTFASLLAKYLVLH